MSDLTALRRRIMYMVRRNKGRPVKPEKIRATMEQASMSGCFTNASTDAAIKIMVQDGALRRVGQRLVENVKHTTSI